MFILRGDLFKVLPCVILFLCFSFLLALRLPCLGKRELILVLFRKFVRFALVWFRLFPLPLGVWKGLRLMIAALPGLFFYLFVQKYKKYQNFLSENIHVLMVTFSVYLNRHVFVIATGVV